LWVHRLIRRLATRIVCVAEQERALGLSVGACASGRTVVIYNGIDVGAAIHTNPHEKVPAIVTVGRLKPPKDHATLIQALGRLVRERELRARLGEAGRRRAEELFDLTPFRRAHLSLYRSLLAERGLPVPAE